jgi:hypothetical protein
MGTKLYSIRQGFSLRTPEGEVFLGGGVVELGDEDAALHAHKIEELTGDKQKEFFDAREEAASQAVFADLEADEKRKAGLEADAAALQTQAAAAAAAAKQI